MNLPHFRRVPLALALAIAASTDAAQAQTTAALRLLPSTATDQFVAHAVAPAPGQLATADLDRTPASLSWPLDPDATLDARPRPFTQQSQAYWIDASESALQQGVRLPLSAAGAVIRLSPHASNPGARIEAQDVVLRAPGPQLHAGVLMQALADEDALREAGMDVPAGSVAFRLDPAFLAPHVELAVPVARGAWLVHVYEPHSKLVLELGAARDGIVAGEGVRVHARFPAGVATASIGGLLSSPDGHSQPVAFMPDAGGGHSAWVVPDPAHAGTRGLWEVHVFAQAAHPGVPRDARTSFSVSMPVARLDGRIERVRTTVRSQPLMLRFGIEAAAASRYQLSAVLYGHAADGSAHPSAIAQSAAWLEAGRGSVDLAFDVPSLSGAGLGPPWELRDLRLVNQADLGLLERRERALVLP
ncbi:MAG: DUF4785 family protein [Lysobacteraceae bacterium]|nr:MAG: DUF4785 family protein [Xanthomonadaceae bacterium]